MLSYYANLRHVMRTAMGVIMRTVSKVKKSVNVSLTPEILEEARKLKINLSAVLTEALIENFARTNAKNGCWIIKNR